MSVPVKLIQKEFWYSRHGQTAANIHKLANGRVDDPLTELGETQAKQAGVALSAYFKDSEHPFERIVASPLIRATKTAQLIQAEIQKRTSVLLPLTIDESLIEANFGEYEGKKLEAWYENWLLGKVFPEKGESFQDLQQRAGEAVNKINQLSGTSLIVAHGTFFRALRSLMGLDISLHIKNATPMKITPPSKEDKGWTLFSPELPVNS
ncbi:histidine phosphatase family protein [Acetobacteraceae bacterium]|nr:histidine phosphatase family protein [Acetobacteraceae bacterium]